MAKCYYSYHFTTRHTSVYITFKFINGYNKTQTDQNICYQMKKKKLLENDKHKYNQVQIAMKKSKLLYQVKISVSETY